jgi:hypothetical protein
MAETIQQRVSARIAGHENHLAYLRGVRERLSRLDWLDEVMLSGDDSEARSTYLREALPKLPSEIQAQVIDAMIKVDAMKSPKMRAVPSVLAEARELLTKVDHGIAHNEKGLEMNREFLRELIKRGLQNRDADNPAVEVPQ